VPDDEFLFDVDVSDEVRFADMLGDLATGILDRVGYRSAVIEDIVRSVRAEVARCVSAGRPQCRVQFRARAGELQIVVSGSRGEWRNSRSLPER
jgi:hypothetical protein